MFNNTRKTSRTIAGHLVTLQEGKRYFASRPIARRRRIDAQRFTISITRMDDRNTAHQIPGLTYDQANQFLAEFNNEECSLSGRVW